MIADTDDYTSIPIEYERIRLIYFQPLSVLLKRNDKTLSRQMKKLKLETKIRMFTDETFNINKYIIDECCNGNAYRVIYNPGHHFSWYVK